MKQGLCTTHSNNYDDLKKTIVKSLTMMCSNYINKDKIKNNVLSNLNKNDKVNNEKELEILNNSIKQINENLDEIYIDKLNKKITENQFERVKVKLEQELNIKKKRYNELHTNVSNTHLKENKIIYEYINNFLDMKEFNRELIINLIDKIEIYEDKSINITVIYKESKIIN